MLVDTGIGLADIAEPEKRLGARFLTRSRPRLDPAETAVRQIERLGHRPEDVRHIVLTHLHRDHAGGLADFPHARIHVHHTEHEAAVHPADDHGHARYNPNQWAHRPDWVTYPPGGERWHGFDAVRPLDGIDTDIRLVPLHGHSRGHTGIAIHANPPPDVPDRAQWLLHGGDAYFYHREIDPEHPRTAAGLALFQHLMQIDRTARRHNQARLRELAANRPRIDIICAHDPTELARHQHKPTDAIRP